MKLHTIKISREVLKLYLCIHEQVHEQVKYVVINPVSLMGSDIKRTINTNNRLVKLS